MRHFEDYATVVCLLPSFTIQYFRDFQKSLTSDAVFVSNAATVSQNAIADPDLLLQKIPVDADEICAALSSFVEKNKRLGVSNDSSTAYGSPSDKKSKSGSSSKNVIIEQQPITEVVGMGKVDASVFSPSPSANIWTSIDTTVSRMPSMSLVILILGEGVRDARRGQSQQPASVAVRDNHDTKSGAD